MSAEVFFFFFSKKKITTLTLYCSQKTHVMLVFTDGCFHLSYTQNYLGISSSSSGNCYKLPGPVVWLWVVDSNNVAFFFSPGDTGDSQVQPVNHSCSSSSLLKERLLAHQRQVVAESHGNCYPKRFFLPSVEGVWFLSFLLQGHHHSPAGGSF